MNPIARYARWLHTSWPAGRVEKLPQVDEHGRTGLPGVYVAGDLAGIPLLKFSVDTGARAVRHMAADPALASLRGEGGPHVVDVLVLGGGVSGVSAALEARALGLSCAVIEASEPFSTIVNFPKKKPIYTYPEDFEPAGAMSKPSHAAASPGRNARTNAAPISASAMRRAAASPMSPAPAR